MSAALKLIEDHSQKVFEKKLAHLQLASNLQQKILIVDDDIDMANAIKILVESFSRNFSCEVVNDPYEALLTMSDKSFDMVLVDQKIPGLEGSVILSKIDEFVDKDPLIIESGRYANLIPAVIMSASEVKLADNFKLKNFVIEKVLNKNDLPQFLSERFIN